MLVHYIAYVSSVAGSRSIYLQSQLLLVSRHHKGLQRLGEKQLRACTVLSLPREVSSKLM